MLLGLEDHREIARSVASLIAQRFAANVSTQSAAQHIKMSRSSFWVPGLEFVVAHVEQPAMLALLKPVHGQPIHALSRRDHILGWLGKIERMRESATGDKKSLSAEPPYSFRKHFAQFSMSLTWPMPPD